MAKFTHAGRKTVSNPLVAVGGASPVVHTDTMVIHGHTMSIHELIRRGLIREATTVGNTTTYQLIQPGDYVNQ